MITLLIALFSVLNNTEIMYCDIKGNVKNPGVYQMVQGEVINDLIERAGGLKKNSYVKNINLSKRVSDEMVVYILNNEEYEDLTYICPVCICEKKKCNNEIATSAYSTTKKILTTSTIKINSTSINTTTNNLKTIITTTIKTTSKNAETTKKITEETTEINLININTASIEELIKLNGIGEKTAIKIIDYRRENIFRTIEDIKNVSGIGEYLFAKIKDYITV